MVIESWLDHKSRVRLYALQGYRVRDVVVPALGIRPTRQSRTLWTIQSALPNIVTYPLESTFGSDHAMEAEH